MRRVRRFAFLAGVTALIFGVAGPALATPDNISQQIRGQGSFTTYHLMQAMDRAYNAADGCRQFVTTGTQRLDEVCVANGPPYVNDTSTGKTENWDHDVAMSDFGIGSGNGRTLLGHFGDPGYPRIDYARSSSFASISGTRFVSYAQDMLAWTAYVGNINVGCDVDRSTGAIFDDKGPLGVAHGGLNGPGASGPGSHPTWGTWPVPPSGTCPAATAAGSVGGGEVHGGAIYPRIPTASLKKIYGCVTPTITDWHDLNGAIPTGTKIVLWAVQDGSGTRKDFDGKIGCSSTTLIDSSDPTFSDGNSVNGERKILENVATPISGFPDAVNGGRTQTCQTANRPGQTTADCPGTNTNGDPINYTQSVYYFSAADWFASAVFTTNNACSPVCDATNTGNNLQGAGTILGGLETVNATRDKMGPECANPAGGCYTFSRYVYNAYRNATASNNAPDWVRDYVGELGWICRPDGAHENDPVTGVNYGTEIENVITAEGFALIPARGTFGVDPPQNIGGGVLAPAGTKCSVDNV